MASLAASRLPFRDAITNISPTSFRQGRTESTATSSRIWLRARSSNTLQSGCVAAIGAFVGFVSHSRLNRSLRRSRPVQTGEQRLKQLEEFVADEVEEEREARLQIDLESVPAGTPRYDDVRRLPGFPFLPEPSYRAFAANVAGDYGFDPAGLCKDVASFVNYREAELKHGRLAMLAALAWPLVEEASEIQLEENENLFPDVLAGSGGLMLPQLTGGTEDQFIEAFFTLVLIIGAIFELNTKAGEEAGDKNFDPLRLKSWSPGSFLQTSLPENRLWMGDAELKHCRLAMVAFAYDVFIELTTGEPVVENTEYIFHKIDAKFLRWDYWTFQPELLDIGDLSPNPNVVL